MSGGGGTVAVGHEAMGATIALVLFVLWTSRRHLTSVFGKAFGTAPHVDDRDEIMSYRAAVITLLVGLVGMGLWLNARRDAVVAYALLRGHCLCRVFCPDPDHRRRRRRLFSDATRPGRVHSLHFWDWARGPHGG